jgi:hypothetical protein
LAVDRSRGPHEVGTLAPKLPQPKRSFAIRAVGMQRAVQRDHQREDGTTSHVVNDATTCVAAALLRMPCCAVLLARGVPNRRSIRLGHLLTSHDLRAQRA